MQVDMSLIQPVLETVVNLVINWEILWGNTKEGLDKKKEVWTKVSNDLYDISDSLFQFKDEIDYLAKNVIIPQAIDFAVEFFKQENSNNFEQTKAPEAVTYVANKIPEILIA